MHNPNLILKTATVALVVASLSLAAQNKIPALGGATGQNDAPTNPLGQAAQAQGQAQGKNKGKGAKKGGAKQAQNRQGAQNAPAGQGAIADPDAANAPIGDRETANIQAKRTRPVPQLAEIGVPRTNYPIPNGALFAAPNGSAKANGLDRNAPTSLVHAIKTAPVGGTIVLKGGDYRGIENLAIPHRMTLQAAPGETAWIKGSIIVTGFTPDNGRWSVAWDKKLTHANVQDLDPNFPRAMDTDMVFLAGKSLRQVEKPAEVVAGTFCVDTTAKKLILGDNPTGKMVESTVAAKGLSIRDKVTQGTIVRGLGFAHFAEGAIESYTNQKTFENNTIAWNGARGLSANGADNVVRGNTFACNGQSGMNGFRDDRLLFENNHVMFNNIEGFRRTWSAGGLKLAITRDATFRGNTIENNQAAGLWLDISCINNNVIGNTVRSNLGIGVFYELSKGGLVAFNLIEDNGAGLMLSDTSDVRAWNNTFVDNTKAIVVKDTARVNEVKAEEKGVYSNKIKAEDIAAGVTWIASNNEFHNNLFAGGRNNKSVLFDAGPATKGKGSGDMIKSLDNNAYARTAPNTPRDLVRWHSGGKSVDFESLLSFRAAHPTYETNAVEIISKSPAALDGAYLAPNSPLLKAGKALPADVKAAAVAAGIKFPAEGVRIGAMGAKSGA